MIEIVDEPKAAGECSYKVVENGCITGWVEGLIPSLGYVLPNILLNQGFHEMFRESIISKENVGNKPESVNLSFFLWDIFEKRIGNIMLYFLAEINFL